MSPMKKRAKLYCNFAAKVDHLLTSRLKKVSNTFKWIFNRSSLRILGERQLRR
jgi:hypothetical protein